MAANGRMRIAGMLRFPSVAAVGSVVTVGMVRGVTARVRRVVGVAGWKLGRVEVTVQVMSARVTPANGWSVVSFVSRSSRMVWSASETVTVTAVRERGGVMARWYRETPRVARKARANTDSAMSRRRRDRRGLGGNTCELNTGVNKGGGTRVCHTHVCHTHVCHTHVCHTYVLKKGGHTHVLTKGATHMCFTIGPPVASHP